MCGKAPPILTFIVEVRKSYEKLVKQLEAEHPGGRIDFFLQVEYGIKAAASVVGVASLIGLWSGTKALRRRHM